MAAKLPDTPISPSDDENSSIITVRSNASNNNDSVVRLHLDTAEDNENNADTVQSASVGSFLTLQPSSSSSTATVIDANNDDSTMQTIVEVVNPLISGQGYANTIAVGRSNDESSYPSFDVNDDDNVAETNYDSLDTYNTASELSLSDKMKNVLQELVKNERVRLSFSQSISEGEDSDSEQNDTDDDANEPLKHDSSDDESATPINAPPTANDERTTEEANGNAVIAQLSSVDTNSNSNNDDIQNANVDDFIYKNPNFLMADDEIDTAANTSQQITGTRNERDEKLKEKLLAELNVQPSTTISIATTIMDKTKSDVDKTESTNIEPDDEESSIHDEIPSTPTSPIETSSKSDSIQSTGSAGKRKKRKNKARKK